jgi:arylsulfatase A-like enzyme/tetratricopeptide (TPR) repeat protein
MKFDKNLIRKNDMRKKIKFIFLLFIIFVVVIVYLFFFRGWQERRPPEPASKSLQSLLDPVNIEEMNVIIFTIDTLRADHLECYGYVGVQTPQINQLAHEGILFEHSIVQTPLTLPSHSSIFTGTYPIYHGIRDNGGFYLDQKHITLAEAMKVQGYTTAGFVAAFVLDSKWGLDQGFDHYYDNFDLTKYKTISLDSVQRRGDEVLAEVYRWLGENQHQKFFAWIHLYDPHTPYDPPEPYKSQYTGKRYRLYDGEIAYTDQLMGEFRDFMEKEGLLEKSLIIFTSDHGESLGEHKESAHGFFIYDSDVRVPLIVRFPGGKLAGSTITNQVRSIDIMPTVLNAVGGEIPETVQGESFLPLMLGGEEEDDRLVYSETYWPRYHYGWSELKFLRKGQYKFIDAPKPELYDVFDDPGEVENLVNSKATLGHEMKSELTGLIEQYSAEGIENAEPQKIDNDSLVKLQALGYIGSFRASSKGKGERLADPKDKIELYNDIKMAQFLVTEEKTEQAEDAIKDVLERDPSVLEARYILGNIFTKQEKYEDAIEEYKKALSVDQEYYDAIFGMALAYRKYGKMEEAIVGFKRLIDIDPKDTKPYFHLSDIYGEQGEIDEAISHLKSAVTLDPEAPVYHNQLGALYLKKNMYNEAEKEIQTALSFERSVPLQNAHFNLGLLHEARGQMELAIQEYKKEQETSPFNHKPDFNLGLLFSKAKELEKAIKEFESCIEKNEKFGNAHVFLAKAYMDTNRDLNQAASLAQKGIDLNLDQTTTILAHFVLADIYNRMGRHLESQQHVSRAKQLQKNL